MLADAFENDPLITYCLGSVDLSRRNESRADLFRVFLSGAAVSSNASIEETDGFLSCGVLIPPESETPNPRAEENTPGLEEMLSSVGLGQCLAREDSDLLWMIWNSLANTSVETYVCRRNCMTWRHR